MSVEVSGRVLRSQSRGRSVAKTNKKSDTSVDKSSVSYEESTIITKSSVNRSLDFSPYNENGIISKHSKEIMNKTQRDIDTDSDADNVYDSGGNIRMAEFLDSGGGGGYSSDDSGGDSPWQNGHFKPAEEIVKYYKTFGDWWNYFPKTDYVYSRASKWYRQEVAPGVPVIPNMARPPLHPVTPPNHFLFSSSKKRYLTKVGLATKSNGAASVQPSSNSRIKNWFFKLITIITSVITTVFSFITGIVYIRPFSNNVSNRSSHAESEPFYEGDSVVFEDNTWGSKLFRWLYRFSTWLFVQEVLIFGYIHNFFAKNKSRKKNRILKFLLFLLLLLLFAGFAYSRLTQPVAESNFVLPFDYSSIHDVSFDYSRFYWFIDYLKLIPDHFVNSFAFLYGLLPAVSMSQYFNRPEVLSKPSNSINSIDSEQLSYLVQQMVRETLERDSAVLLEDIVNHPKFKLLMEKAIVNKADSWDPSFLLASEQWRVAIKEVVEEHYTQNYKTEEVEDRFRSIETKVDWNAEEIIKLQESTSKLEEKFLILEKGVRSLVQQFVTHRQLEEAIKNLTTHLYADSKLDEKLVIEQIKSDVTVKVHEEVTYLFKTLQENKHQVEDIKGDINLEQVKDYVRTMIERALALYDADKTGLVDYALESSGGNIVSTRCTEIYAGGQATYKLFGIALWRRSNSPRTVIQPGVHPGECWAFAGQQGYIVLELSATIIVTAFTVEHIPRSLAPQERIDSAPKDFSVWGLKYETDMDPIFLGRFRFMENGTSLQKFEALPQEEPFRLVELIIESNHGNLDYTCLYRFRVHGVPVS